jgi:hypothetical protein
MDQSTFLHNFIESRGAPTALEIEGGRYESTKVILYYPREQSVYTMVPYATENENREWIIRGPFQIERDDYRQVMRHQRQLKTEPVLQIGGVPRRFFAEPDKNLPAREMLLARIPPTPVPTPRPKPKPKPVAKKNTPVIKATPAHGGETEPEPAPTVARDVLATQREIQEVGPFNTDQQAIRNAEGFAERDAINGDLLHLVRSASETLASLASWYTLAEKNAAEIATYNKLPADKALEIGSMVRIPKHLLKRVRRREG